jgi:hypothetical protein
LASSESSLNTVLFAQPSKAGKSDVVAGFPADGTYASLYRPGSIAKSRLCCLRPPGNFLLSLHRRGVTSPSAARPPVCCCHTRIAFTLFLCTNYLRACVLLTPLRLRQHGEASRRGATFCSGLRGKNDEIGAILGICRADGGNHTRAFYRIGVENRYGAITTVTHVAARDGAVQLSAT